MAFNVNGIGGSVVRFLSSLSVARAVDAQAKVTGGAMNTAVHSSIQTASDRAKHRRQESLVGHYSSVDPTAALEPTHTATGEDDHSPAERRDYLFLKRRKNGRQGGPGDGHGAHDEHHAPDYLDPLHGALGDK